MNESSLYCLLSEWGNDFNLILKNLLKMVLQTRTFGVELGCEPKHVHFAQFLCWKFYIIKGLEKYSPEISIPLFYQILQRDYHLSPKVNIGSYIELKRHISNNNTATDELLKIIEENGFHHNLSHPTEHLHKFITSQFTEKDIAYARYFISSSFSMPCCILYSSETIAEGSAILTAALNGNKESVIPRTIKALSYINDFKRFTEEQKSNKALISPISN